MDKALLRSRGFKDEILSRRSQRMDLPSIYSIAISTLARCANQVVSTGPLNRGQRRGTHRHWSTSVDCRKEPSCARNGTVAEHTNNAASRACAII